jgi:hypothetical protein
MTFIFVQAKILIFIQVKIFIFTQVKVFIFTQVKMKIPLIMVKVNKLMHRAVCHKLTDSSII